MHNQHVQFPVLSVLFVAQSVVSLVRFVAYLSQLVPFAYLFLLFLLLFAYPDSYLQEALALPMLSVLFLILLLDFRIFTVLILRGVCAIASIPIFIASAILCGLVSAFTLNLISAGEL